MVCLILTNYVTSIMYVLRSFVKANCLFITQLSNWYIKITKKKSFYYSIPLNWLEISKKLKLTIVYPHDWFDFDFWCFNATFSNIMTTSFRDGRSRSTRREQPTMGKQLVIFITCGCESSAPSFVIYKLSRARTHAVLVIGLYALLSNPTT